MRKFLERIKLKDYIRAEMKIQKTDFVNILSEHINKGRFGIMEALDSNKSNKNKFKGYVGNNDFKIKEIFVNDCCNFMKPLAKGSYKQQANQLIIEIEIVGLRLMTVFFYILGLIALSIFIIIFSFTSIKSNLFVILFFILMSILMLGLPYLSIKKQTKKLKHGVTLLLRSLARKTKNKIIFS